MPLEMKFLLDKRNGLSGSIINMLHLFLENMMFVSSNVQLWAQS